MSVARLMPQPGPPLRLGTESLESGIHWEQLARRTEIALALKALHRISVATGGYVQILPALSLFPVLIGNDKGIIPLYDFIEVVDGLLDYNVIREEFPNLSHAQIHGAILFLRKVAQLNIKGVDIDELEDEYFSQDENFMAELKSANADRETTRVFNFDELKSP